MPQPSRLQSSRRSGRRRGALSSGIGEWGGPAEGERLVGVRGSSEAGVSGRAEEKLPARPSGERSGFAASELVS